MTGQQNLTSERQRHSKQASICSGFSRLSTELMSASQKKISPPLNNKKAVPKLNPQKINKHMSYTIEEISRVLDVVPKTCYRWIDEGLPIVPESKKPILILGSDLKEFLREKSRKRKVPLGRSQFYCFTCKRAVFAKRGSIEVLKNRKTARCRVCNGLLCRLL